MGRENKQRAMRLLIAKSLRKPKKKIQPKIEKIRCRISTSLESESKSNAGEKNIDVGNITK